MKKLLKNGGKRFLIFLTTFVFLLSASVVASFAAQVNESSASVWSKYNIKLYGKIKVDFNYDTASFAKYNDFIGAVAMGSGHRNDSTNFNPRDSRIGFIASYKYGDWLVKGRIETDFYGGNEGDNLIPRMRLAYIELKNTSGTDIVVGQDWVPVAALNPSTIDFGILTAAGNLWWRVPQITVRQNFGNIQILGSIMKHRRQSTEADDTMPWILARIQYKDGILGQGNMIALGGGYRHANYGDYGPDGNLTSTDTSQKNTDRYLVCLEAKFGFGPVEMKGELWTGQGIGRNFLRYDLGLAYNGAPARATGGWADITYKVNSKVNVTAGYGFDNPDNKDIGDWVNDRRFTKNEQYFLNTWYSLAKPLKIGAEWVYVETQRHQEIDTGNRFTVSMQYVF